MGSRDRIPPPPLRRPLPSSAMLHPDPFGPGLRPPQPGPFPPFDMLPPPEVIEQKLAAQHVEMQKLSTENRRLAATHGTLRQDLAAAQHELQMLHAHIGVIKTEREQHMRGLLDKIAKMEAEVKAADTVRSQLQQARAEAESLVSARQELVSKVQKLNQELHKVHTDTQQIPALMSELDGLRQEFQRCRVSYEHEKKLFSDHLESLQNMEKNYLAMCREVEKLRSQLSNTANTDSRTGGPYGGASGNNDNGASALATVQNTYEPSYAVHQGQGIVGLPGNPVASGANATGAAANLGPGTGTGTGTSTYFGAQPGSVPRPGYDPSRAPLYDPSRASAYDPSRVSTYDPSRGLGYDLQRAAGYDSQMGNTYGAQGGPGYDMQRGAVYDAQRIPGYDAQRQSTYNTQRELGYDVQQGISYDASGVAVFNAASRGAAISQGQVPLATNMPYGPTTPTAHAVSGYQAHPQGGNSVRK